MNEKELAGRLPFVWRGIDPEDDTRRLTDAIAKKAITKLFNVDGGLVLFNEGKNIPATRPILHELTTKNIAGVRLVAHGDTFKIEYFAFDFATGGDLSKGPNDRTLANITTALLPLVAKGPSTPHRLSEQQRREVRYRIGIGEPKDNLAREYRVDRATIEQLAKAE